MDENNNSTVEYDVTEQANTETDALDKGEKLFLDGKYNEALNVFKNAIRSNASSTLYLDIGNCYYQLGDYPEALTSWQKAIDLDASNSSAYSNIGNLYYKTGSLDKAISYWIISRVTNPEDGNVCLNLAVAYDKKGMRFESIRYFEAYIKYADDKVTMKYKEIQMKMKKCFEIAEVYLSKGVECQQAGDAAAAAACYFKSLATYPVLSKSNQNLGSIFYQDNNLELAIKYWKQSSYIDKKYSRTFKNLALAYMNLEDYTYAYCYYYRYKVLIENSPEEVTKIENIMARLKLIIDKIPQKIELHLKFAQKHLSQSNFYDAIEEFTNYAILLPDKQAEYKDLIDKLESYINPEFKLIQVFMKNGKSLMARGKYEEAIPLFERTVRLSGPKFIEYSLARGKITECERMIKGTKIKAERDAEIEKAKQEAIEKFKRKKF